MQVVYAKQPLPGEWSSAIFLAGPTPRGNGTESWRPEALRLLEHAGYTGVVFVPEPEDGVWGSGPDAYNDQVEWEREGLEMADIILFWVPRDMETMPALTTNVEFGRYVTSGKVVFGAPEWASSVRYLEHLLRQDVGGVQHKTLANTVGGALTRLQTLTGSARSGGGRYVPLHIWNLPSFQAWYTAQVAAGNRLDEARLLWQFSPPKARFPFAWALWVKVWIGAESRHKENEFVIARPDISCVAMWTPGVDVLQTEVVLVREFRSPARTTDGYIRELAGGSSLKPGHSALQIAADEVHEETGLLLDPGRFAALGSRQVAGTLSSHHAHLFGVRLTHGEMEQARALAEAHAVHGVEEDSERTFVEVTTFGDLLRDSGVDWSVLGMIVAALFADQ